MQTKQNQRKSTNEKIAELICGIWKLGEMLREHLKECHGLYALQLYASCIKRIAKTVRRLYYICIVYKHTNEVFGESQARLKKSVQSINFVDRQIVKTMHLWSGTWLGT